MKTLFKIILTLLLSKRLVKSLKLEKGNIATDCIVYLFIIWNI
jgi:hypothetical protein